MASWIQFGKKFPSAAKITEASNESYRDEQARIRDPRQSLENHHWKACSHNLECFAIVLIRRPWHSRQTLRDPHTSLGRAQRPCSHCPSRSLTHETSSLGEVTTSSTFCDAENLSPSPSLRLGVGQSCHLLASRERAHIRGPLSALQCHSRHQSNHSNSLPERDGVGPA